MRLICPNCEAQYEVPNDVMPLQGRDVQCSNCGETWFQKHPGSQGDDQGNLSETRSRVKTGAPATPASAPEQSRLQRDLLSDPDVKPSAEPETAPEVAEPEPKAEAPSRRGLDPAVANVLRAEAAIEVVARKKESDNLESQPDLGLNEAPDHSERQTRGARARVARMHADAPEVEEPEEEDVSSAQTVLASRRDLLPDIEEINSTLRSNNDRSPDVDPGQTAQVEIKEKRSSRRGFTVTIALIVLLVLAYLYAPQISENIPETASTLTTYVEMVDNGRVWLDGQVTALLSWLDEVAAPTN
ncbi:MAG: zinc-ribbon domain-containing protein [Roseobacter sp.]